MTNATWLRTGDIAIAVGFDEYSQSVVDVGVDLAQRLGRGVCLMHVLEPWAERYHSLPFAKQDPLWNAALAVEKDARQAALERLDALASRLPKGLLVRKLVVSGKRVQTLCREAKLMGSGLLIVGAGGPKAGRRLGLSTALALMAASPVPLLVLNGQSQRTIGTNLRLLLADDLSRDGLAAVEFGLGLATALGGELFHAHVTGIDQAVLEASLTAALAAAHAPGDAHKTATDVLRMFEHALADELAARSGEHRAALVRSGSRYEPRILAGDALNELAVEAERIAADVVVFGRHKLVHTAPFGLGRIPFSALTVFERPLLIVPNE